MLVNEYFKDKEVMCKCGCGVISPRYAVSMLYAVRIIFNLPIIINSAIRCKQHNEDEEGSENSMHLPYYERDGYPGECAFDIVAISKSKHRLHEWRLIQICQFVGFTGIGFRDNTFLHIDNRHINNYGVVWGYSK